MARIGLAFRVFVRVLRDAEFARRLQPLTELPATTVVASAAPVAALPALPARSDALSLLAALQREARLIDFLQESISAYSDAQIGAAVRDVHRDAAAALERMLALRPVMSESEGTSVEVRPGIDAARVRLVGNVTGTPPYKGTLRHGGWQATKLDLPAWTGTDAAARILAPAEVEL